MMSTKRFIPLSVFCLLFVTYGYINQGWGWNQNSRLDLLHALVVHHRVSIDAYQDNTGDKEQLNGHYYSEKAPGLAVAAMPTFLATYGVFRAVGIDIDGDVGWKISSWITTIGSVGILAALGGMCFFLFLRKRIGDFRACIATFAVFLGSLPFPYATMMFSHGATMGILAIALWVFDVASVQKRSSWRYDYLLGFLCGFAITCEYPAAIAAGLFFVLTWARGWPCARRFILGAIAPLLLIPLYNWAVSGSLFTLGYSNVDFAGMQDGFFGVTSIKPEAITGVLLSQFRGLLFWTPFLLLAFAGYPILYRTERTMFWLTLFIPVAYLLFVSSYAYWDGGFAFGPRHLAGALPFLAVAAGVGLTSLPVTGGALAVISIVLTGLATIINAMPPNEFHKPLVEFYAPSLAAGQMTMNLGSVLGLPGLWSIVPLLMIVIVAGFGLLWIVHEPEDIPHVKPSRALPSSLSARMRRLRKKCTIDTLISSIRHAGIVRCALWIMLIGGLLLRFVVLSSMEFKGDEFSALVMAYQHAHGIVLAKTGLASSFGLVNPPFFIWLLSIPAAFTGNPVIVTGFVALLNVAGMILLYAFLRRAFSGDTALWTTALLATAPWALIFSRKLWPQDVMILFLVLFYIALFASMKKGKLTTTLLLFFSLAALTQLHLIAWFLPLLLFLFLDVFQVRIRFRDLTLGFLVLAALYMPYAMFHVGSSFQNLLDFLRADHHVISVADFLEHLSWSVNITSGLRFDDVLGSDGYAFFARHYHLSAPLGFFLLYGFGVVAGCIYLLEDALRNIRLLRTPTSIHSEYRVLLFMLAMFVTLIGAYASIGAAPFAHYHVIFYPLMPLLFVLAMQKTVRTGLFPAMFVHLLVVLIVASNLYMSGSFLVFLRTNPEKIGGSYGTPYVVERDEWTKKLHDSFTLVP